MAKRIARWWGIGGLLTAVLLIGSMAIIDGRLAHITNQVEVGALQAEYSADSLAPELAIASKQAPATVEFDPEVEALSDLDIEMRMAGLPAQGDHLAFREHLDARGWGVSPTTSSEYANYDWETLESMADSGDFVGLSALDSKITSVYPVDYERLGKLREKAAMFGMTVSAIMHGRTLLGEYEVLLKHPNMDESPTYKDADPRKRIVDGLAWLDFAASRGDLQAVQYMTNAVADPKLAITEEDLQAAKVEAQRIYQRLSEQRAARGLPEFDDHIPPEAIRMYEQTLRAPSSVVSNQGD